MHSSAHGFLRCIRWTVSTPIAGEDPAFVAAVETTGRRKLVVCGLWMEVCLAQTVASAIEAGYALSFVADCSGGISVEAHEEGKRRMVQPGAVPMAWPSVKAKLCPDNSAPGYQALYPWCWRMAVPWVGGAVRAGATACASLGSLMEGRSSGLRFSPPAMPAERWTLSAMNALSDGRRPTTMRR